jgi:hypothetical protein
MLDTKHPPRHRDGNMFNQRHAGGRLVIVRLRGSRSMRRNSSRSQGKFSFSYICFSPKSCPLYRDACMNIDMLI